MAKLFTRAEVAKFTGTNGTAPYLILHNVVYDVTAWLHEHPGGNTILLENAGADATVPFEDQGHSKVAVEIRKQYAIGELVPNECKLWCRVFRSVDTQLVETLEFYYKHTEQLSLPLEKKWDELRQEHGIGANDGSLVIRDVNGELITSLDGLPEDKFPVRIKYTSGSKSQGGGGVVSKVVLAAALAVYVRAAVNSKPIPAVTYSKALRHVHLLMAVGATGSIWTVSAANRCDDDKSKKAEWIELHKATGVMMLVAIAARLWLRMNSAIPPKFPGPQALQQFEGVSHKLFYAIMTLLPVSGIAYGYIGGTGVPILGSKSDANKDDIQTAQKALDFHRLMGRFFEFVWLPFHLGTTAYHYQNGRGVVRRISPFL